MWCGDGGKVSELEQRGLGGGVIWGGAAARGLANPNQASAAHSHGRESHHGTWIAPRRTTAMETDGVAVDGSFVEGKASAGMCGA